MDKLAPIFVSIWTGLVFTTIFAIDNPLINDDGNLLTNSPGVLLAIAFAYVVVCVLLIFLARKLCRASNIRRLEKNGFYAQEYFPNRNFYFSADGNDLALDKRTKRIGFSNAAKVFIFRFADIFDFNVNVEKGGITGHRRLIIIQFFMGFKGAVILNIRVESQEAAIEMLRSLRGVVPEARLIAANKRLMELCSLPMLPDLGFEKPLAESTSPGLEEPVMSEEERTRETERRRQAELERFRKLAMERKQQLEAERQRMALEGEMLRQRGQHPAAIAAAPEAQQQPPEEQPSPPAEDAPERKAAPEKPASPKKPST